MSGGPNELTTDEQAAFDRLDGRLKAVVLESDLEQGQLLRQIREQRLYRQDFVSWKAYCAERLPYGKRQADRVILFAEMMASWDPGVPAPTGERQARPLVGLRPGLRRIVAERLGGFEKASARRVAETVAEIHDRRPGPPRAAALVAVRGGAVTLGESRVIRDLRAMHRSALRISGHGPHVIPDAVAAIPDDEVDEVRELVEATGAVLARFAAAFTNVHGGEPARQQRWPHFERPQSQPQSGPLAVTATNLP